MAKTKRSPYRVELLGHTLRVVDTEGNDVELVGPVNHANREKAEALASALAVKPLDLLRG
jgi:hypothetical protein